MSQRALALGVLYRPMTNVMWELRRQKELKPFPALLYNNPSYKAPSSSQYCDLKSVTKHSYETLKKGKEKTIMYE